MSDYEYFDNEEEALAYARKIKGEKPHGRRVVEELFPGVSVTSDYRGRGHLLSKKNPKSYHATTDRAVDIKAIPGMTFEDVAKKINDAGYDILELQDEYTNPSKNATGPHWHFVIGDKKEPTFDTEEEALAYAAKVKGAGVASAPAVKAEKPWKRTEINQEVSPQVQRAEVDPRDVDPNQEYVVNDDQAAAMQDIQRRLFSIRTGGGAEKVISGIKKDYGAVFPNMTDADLVAAAKYYMTGGKAPVDFYSDKTNAEANEAQLAAAGIEPTQSIAAPPPLTLPEVAVKTAEEMASLAGEGINAALTRQVMKGLSTEKDFNREMEKVLDERGRRQRFWQDQADRTENPILDEASKLVGGLAGDANVTYLLDPGRSVSQRIASQAAIGGLTDVAAQGLEASQGLREGIDPEQVGMNTLASGVFQGGVEGLAKLASKFKTEVRVEDDGTPYVEVPDPVTKEPVRVYDPSKPISAKAQLKAGTSLGVPKLPENTSPEIAWNTKAAVESKLGEVTASWKEAPKFSVYGKFDEVDDALKIQIMRDTEGDPSQAKAWLDENGTVHAIAENLDGPEDVPALAFHEALGHYGLSKLFGKRLDSVLEAMYKTNPEMQQKVSDWLDTMTPPENGRKPEVSAAEEVLAEASETGPFSATQWDRIKNVVKDFLRRVPSLKDMKYSDREVFTILSMAHDSVIFGGKGTFVGGSGIKYIRKLTHVSPHDFTNIDEENPYGKFDHSKMGSGEGAQIYGWGTYTGEKTRDFYMDQFSHRMGTTSSVTVGNEDLSSFAKRVIPPDLSIQKDFDDALKEATNELSHLFTTRGQDEVFESLAEYIDELENYQRQAVTHYNTVYKYVESNRENLSKEEISLLNKDLRETKSAANEAYYRQLLYKEIVKTSPKIGLMEAKKPRTYDVYSTPEQESRMMRWDDRLDKQPPVVQKAFKDLGFEIYDRDRIDALREAWTNASEDVTALYEGVIRPAEERVAKELGSYWDYAEKRVSEIDPLGLDKEKAERQAYKEYQEAGSKLLKADNEYTAALKEMKELQRIEDEAHEAYKASENIKAETAYKSLAAKFKLRNNYRRVEDAYKDVSLALLERGVIGNRYEDGFSRNSEKKTYNIVWFDENEAKIVNKYMRKKPQDKGKTKPETETPKKVEERAEKFAGNINLDNLNSLQDIKAVIGLVGKELPKTRVTHAEVIEAADSLGMTEREVTAYANANGGARLLAMRRVLVRSAERVLSKAEEIYGGDNSDINRRLFQQYMTRHRAIQEAVSNAVAEAGRVLNAMKIAADRGGDAVAALRYMLKEGEGLPAIADPDAIDQLAAKIVEHRDNPKAQTKLMKDAFKVYPEDYLVSFMYNMMLWNPGTQIVNGVGAIGSILQNSVEQAIAIPIGAARSLVSKGSDKITAREWAARQKGFVHALMTAGTYREAGRSFMEGRPTHQVSKVEVGSNIFSKAAEKSPMGLKTALKGGAMGIEAPTRTLALVDSLFRSLIETSALNGMAHRKAAVEGLTGDAYAQRVSDLVAEPTLDMKLFADTEAAVLQLVDDPSSLGKALERFKSHPARDAYGSRALRVAMHMAVPFSRVADRLFFAAIRRIPIVGFLDRVNQADWKAGGARRDLVIARMIMGGTLIGAVSAMYEEGMITANGPSNYDQAQQWRAEGKQPNSVLIDGEWYPLRGLDMIQPLVNMVGSFLETKDTQEFKDEAAFEKFFTLLGTTANGFNDNTFMAQLTQFFAMLGKGPMAENARENYVANLSTRLIPTVVKHKAELDDGVVRDKTGDGTASGKILGNIKGAIPILREELPVRHDIYGRPQETHKNIWTIAQSTKQTTDPVVQEMARLAKVNDGKPVVTGVDRGDIRNSIGLKDAPAEVVQAYQQLAGELIYASLKEHVEDPSWSEMSDEEKITLSKKIVKEMKKYAREDLFTDAGTGQ